MVSLQCENGGYLSGAFTCWSMSSVDGSPDKQIACPLDVQGEDNCSDTDQCKSKMNLIDRSNNIGLDRFLINYMCIIT